MTEFSRREFVAGSLGGLFSSGGGRSGSSAGGRQIAGPTTVVSSASQLQSAFENLTPGERVYISPKNAPYRTRTWLDVDVDAVTVVGPGTKRLIVPADGANVGGIRIGHNDACEDVEVRGVGYHGNPEGQDPSALRLHGIVVRDAQNVTLRDNYLTRLHPYHVHNKGGSAISLAPESSLVRVLDNRISDTGDRGIQMGGQGIVVSGNVITDGYDRAISLDVWPGYETDDRSRAVYQARNVSVVGNVIGNNFTGSCIGVGGIPKQADRGYYSIVNNVGFGIHKSLVNLGFKGYVRNVSVVGNVGVQSDSNDGAKLRHVSGINVDATNARNVIVVGNEVYDYPLAGMDIDAGAEEFTVSNNLVSGSDGPGIRIAGRYGTVCGNSVRDAGKQGIDLEGARNVLVSGNRIRGARWAAIAARNESAPSRHQIQNNYVTSWNRGESNAAAIVVRSGRNVIRNNYVRSAAGDGAPAIVDRTQSGENVYSGNYATGDDPWVIDDPTATVSGMTPPVDVHRGRTDADGDRVVRTTFDRPYAERPPVRFGRRGGGIQDIEYVRDDDDNFVGLAVHVGDENRPLDLFVGR